MAPELWLAPQAWAAVEASEWLELSLREDERKEGIAAVEDLSPGTPGVRREAPLPEELTGDGPMLIWTAPSEGAGTSHRRHPGGDGDSVFTSRTSSPIKAYAGQSRDIRWCVGYGVRGVGGRLEEGWGCRREETVHLAGRVC